MQELLKRYLISQAEKKVAMAWQKNVKQQKKRHQSTKPNIEN